MAQRRDRNINAKLSEAAKAETATITGGWTFSGTTTMSDLLLDTTGYLSVQGGASDLGQVGQIAFVDISGGVGRFGSYNWDTTSYQPVQLIGSTVSVSGAATFDSLTTFQNRTDFTKGAVGGQYGSTINIYSGNPQVTIWDTGAAANEGAWNLIGGTTTFKIRSLSDDYGTAVDAMGFVRGTGTAVDNVSFYRPIKSDMGGGEVMIIKDDVAGGNSYNAWIQWKDSSDVDQAYIGFGSGSNETFYINNQSGGDILLNTSGDVDLACGTTGALEITGSSYKTNPTGLRLGQYSSTIGYLQVPGNGQIDIWNGATSTIATFAETNKAVTFYGNFTADTAGTTISIGGTTTNISPSGNLNITTGGTAQCLSGGDFRVYDSTNTDWFRLVDNGTYSYVQSSANPIKVQAAQSGACEFSIGVSVSVADDAQTEFTNNGTGYGMWFVMNNYNTTTFAIVTCSGSTCTVISKGGNVSVGASGTNPDVDTDVNLWTDADGHLHIKNRMGSTRRFTAYCLSG